MRRLSGEAEGLVQGQIGTTGQICGLTWPQLTAESVSLATRQQSTFFVVCGPVVPVLMISCGGGCEEGCVCVVQRTKYSGLVFSQLKHQPPVSPN